ncbi:MAG: hypothetical protein N3A54_00500 [Patescibacteria group bacterium]|nr:hypothetical protein [Patescibacteria group bacterium]
MRDIKELLDSTIDLPDKLKEELVTAFNEAVEEVAQKKVQQEAFKWLKDIDVNKPLEYLANDPEFRRLVTAWDRSNPDITRAQLLRSFPAAFKDLQGNTIAEPLLSFFLDILNAIVKDPALMQRVVRHFNTKDEEESVETQETEPMQEGFRFLKIFTENAEEYLEKEKFVLDSGYKFAFYADDQLMPVSADEATHKVFVKTVTVASDEEDKEFSFVAKKMVALEWKPEYGGVGPEEEAPETPEKKKSSEEEEEVDLEMPEEDEVEVPEEEEEPLVDKVNEYLEYVVDQFMKENKIAIENGIKVSIAERVLNGIKSVLKENNIHVTEEESAIVKTMEEKLAKTEETLNSLYEKNIDLYKKNKELQQRLFEARVEKISAEVFDKEVLSESVQEKVKKLFNMISFTGNESDDEIRTKLIEIKEAVATTKERKTITEKPEIKNNKNSSEKVNKLFKLDKVSEVSDIEPKKSDEDVIIEVLKRD